MLSSKQLSLSFILRTFRMQIGVTWLLVSLENVLLALIPYLIGTAIDALLAKQYESLYTLGLVLVLLTLVAVMRRVYDTRIYGTIRVELGCELGLRHAELAVSARTARMDMARELVDFLEEQVPELLTAAIQIVVALVILAFFHQNLLLSALAMTAAMIGLYSLVHRRFYTLNAGLNGQMEMQVGVLELKKPKPLLEHLRSLRRWEVKISDTEAGLYGVIFLMVIAFILYNLWFGTSLPNISTGSIYSIVSYSWSYVEAALVLPYSLQSLTRLHEITQRINRAVA